MQFSPIRRHGAWHTAALMLAPVLQLFGGGNGELAGQTSDSVRRIRGGAVDGESRAVIVDGVPLVHTTQLLATDADGRLVGGDHVPEQTRQALANVGRALAAVNSTIARIVKLNVYVARDDVAPQVRATLAAAFPEAPPAVCYVTTPLPLAGALVGLDALATCERSAPRADVASRRGDGLAGHPRQAHVAVLPLGSRIYVAGQAEKGDLREATRKTLESLRATLQHLGRTESDIVQLKSFVTPLAQVAEVEDEFRKFFATRLVPPVAFVEWESSLPIEIELIAAGGPSPADADRPQARAEYLTPPGMTTPTIYSRVSRIHGPRTIFISGLYGPNGASAATQVTEIFTELGRVLDEAGGDLLHLSKATYYVANEDTSKQLNELRPQYYDPQRPPAASKALVRGVGLTGRGITIDMLAVPAR